MSDLVSKSDLIKRLEERANTAPELQYTYAEFKTVWGHEPKAFERLTASNHIKVIMEEFRWGETEPYCFKVEPSRLPPLEGA